jgi:hypothetical protein
MTTIVTAVIGFIAGYAAMSFVRQLSAAAQRDRFDERHHHEDCILCQRGECDGYDNPPIEHHPDFLRWHTRTAGERFEPGRVVPASDIISDLARTYEHGCVAPDGSIWNSPTSRLTTGVVRLTLVEAAKAEAFGWKSHGKGAPGFRYMKR